MQKRNSIGDAVHIEEAIAMAGLFLCTRPSHKNDVNKFKL